MKKVVIFSLLFILAFSSFVFASPPDYSHAIFDYEYWVVFNDGTSIRAVVSNDCGYKTYSSSSIKLLTSGTASIWEWNGTSWSKKFNLYSNESASASLSSGGYILSANTNIYKDDGTTVFFQRPREMVTVEVLKTTELPRTIQAQVGSMISGAGLPILIIILGISLVTLLIRRWAY